MCERQAHRREPQMAAEGAYEGQTMRLDLARGERRAACNHRSFPWWALWLIWPLIMLMKWTVPLTLGAIAAIAGALGGLIAPIVAVVLIAAGIMLLLRG